MTHNFDTMRERIQSLVDEYAEIERKLGDPDVIADREAFVALGRRLV